MANRLSAHSRGWAGQPDDPLGSALALHVPEYVDAALPQRRDVPTNIRMN